jgi:nucleolar protein 9
MDPFASHVIRALLILLSFRPPEERPSSSLRSKKSTAFKSRQGPMKSIITTSESAVQPSEKAAPPEEFLAMGRKFVLKIRSDLGENEVRALAGNKVASPVLQVCLLGERKVFYSRLWTDLFSSQLLLELEVEYGMSDEPNSLMDRVLVGMITHARSLFSTLRTATP